MNRETALLRLLAAPGLGARSVARLLLRLAAEQLPLEDFVALPADHLVREYALAPASADALASAGEEARELAEHLPAHRIRMVTIVDDGYPELLARRLGRTAPPVLFTRGDLGLLRVPMVACAGARECSAPGLAFARALAAALVRHGANIVSGYAPGIDTAAHGGALAAGGVTTAVLASGILHFTPRPGLASLGDETNTLVVSEFFPTMPWRSHSAMQRNRTICAMAHAMVIVESGVSGGTFAAGRAALEVGCPLCVVDWQDPPPSAEGNRLLIRRGGVPVADLSGALRELTRRLHSEGPGPVTPELFG
ncbi:MAG TPA: DNA-processing protein DprA [candidate division Zixibacteria bacterium]|nr:DNA-protecting protein DprA [candidate division Zixibacteria bacterium]MDD4917757.1 DNA-processing protein DprA [candidate division Zixibacteria bacterium]HOD67128.1 DNA-processing protein DprA [candidate division Zixibacteria bacterium]HOZ07807.1 DNA-processing protein DprA [candidate division Zixibacteria bacterium]HPI31729.1 DNA-processing protein DprA [candidate division Zixibacteria bacterium]